ncbi:DUF1491 family protein [uncultured Sphingomonas sp.]|uniref:DUF1491 family protein n=1 Tax=uncultured Sphingomonas sp. TaxID=158754 RepID=UPI0035CB01CD
MSDRLASGLLVNALIRRVQAEGGFATVLAKGDETAGALLVIATYRGGRQGAFEPGRDVVGNRILIPVGPDSGNIGEVTAYWTRRRVHDPDLWVVELDVAGAERLAAETLDLG